MHRQFTILKQPRGNENLNPVLLAWGAAAMAFAVVVITWML